MARVDKQAELQEQVARMETQMNHTQEKKRRSPLMTCSLILAAGVLLVIGIIVWAVASTGLVEVPVVTSLAYREPVPVRLVEAGTPMETLLQETFTSTLTQRIYEGGGTLEDRTLEVRIPEDALTASVRTLAQEAGQDWIDADRLQIAIEPGVGAQMFAPLGTENNELNTALTATFDLQATNGLLEVIPSEVKIGSFKIPDVFIAATLERLLEQELAKLNQSMVGYARISQIDVVSGALLVTGEIAIEIRPAQ